MFISVCVCVWVVHCFVAWPCALPTSSAARLSLLGFALLSMSRATAKKVVVVVVKVVVVVVLVVLVLALVRFAAFDAAWP